ncbi:hypothetical protein ACFUTX_14935 [Microbacterium sp. NPDC057407]|uniref:hypothetical protein n=1 Tax=Microbacterium sp. NPDC057407 TaxID=3346120 RepID=UPI003672AF74
MRRLVLRSAAVILAASLLAGCTSAAPDAGSVTSSPTPSRNVATPTPSPTPTLDPEGVAAFEGDCTAVFTDAEVSELLGVAMAPLRARWSPDADGRLGGVECWWGSTESYMGGELMVSVYPTDSAAPVAGGAGTSGCTVAYLVQCATERTDDGLWVWVRAGTISTTGAEQLGEVTAIADAAAATVAERAAQFPPPYAATRTADWWSFADCADVVQYLVSAGVLTPTSRLDGRFGQGSAPARVTSHHGLFLWCTAVDDGSDGHLSSTSFALWPGGAPDFPQAAAVALSEPFDVPGADAAVHAPGLDALEGGNSLLVAAVGPNLVGVPVGISEEEHKGFLGSLVGALRGR